MGIYDTLNEQQQEAVFLYGGAAFASCWCRVWKDSCVDAQDCLSDGSGCEGPYHIMAITFTNKAAKEMRERVDDLVGFGAEHIWVSTFHSTCVRILRRHIDKLGYGNSFTIYDADDQKSLINKSASSIRLIKDDAREKDHQ